MLSIFFSSRTRIYYLLILGWVLSLISFSWMWTLLPLSWLGLPGIPGILALSFIVLSISILGATPFIFFELVFLLQKRLKHPIVFFLFFIIIFILIEIIRGLLLSLFFIGAGSRPSMDWTFFNLGYFISFDPFLGWASLLYVYGLTICFAFLLFLAYLLYKGQKKEFTWFLLVFIVITFVFNTIKDDEPKAIAIQNIIVYPEGKEYPSTEKDKLYIMGSHEVENGKKFNISNFYFNGEKMNTFRKEFLMPFGEYIPILFKSFARFYLNNYGGDKDYAYWEHFRFGYYEGDNRYRVFEKNGVRIAVILCSEITSYDILQRIKSEKPDIVYLRGSYINFNKSKLFYFFLDRWIVTSSQYLGVPIILVKEE